MRRFHKRYLDFCHPLIKGLQHTYTNMARTNLTTKTPYIKEDDSLPGDISAVLTLNGKLKGKDFQGIMLLSWPTELYLKTASKILHQEYKELVDSIQELGEEICQMVIGKANAELQSKGYVIEKSKTISLKGKESSWRPPSEYVTIVTPMESWMGKFFVELNYFDSNTDETSEEKAPKESTPESNVDFDANRAP